MKTIVASIQYRRDTAANWTAANPVLKAGEPGFESDTAKFKVGNGTSGWNALSYATGNDGATWRSGSTVPANGTGTDGDYYLRTTNGDVYLRSAGTYSIVANLLGPTGPTGPSGVAGSIAQVQNFVSAANLTAAQTAISLLPGTNIQAYNARLDAFLTALANADTANSDGYLKFNGATDNTLIVDPVAILTSTDVDNQISAALASYATQSYVGAQIVALKGESDPFPQYLLPEDGAVLFGSDSRVSTLEGKVTNIEAGLYGGFETPQYAINPNHICVSTHFISTSHSPWIGAAVNTGSLSSNTSDSESQGMTTFKGGTVGNNQGYRITTSQASCQLRTGCIFEAVFKPIDLTTGQLQIGFIDSLNEAESTDGAYFIIAGATLTAKNSAAGVRSSPASGPDYTVTSRKYLGRIVVGASSIAYKIYEYPAMTLVYDKTISTNMPGVTDLTGSGVIATSTGTTSPDIVTMDRMYMYLT